MHTQLVRAASRVEVTEQHSVNEMGVRPGQARLQCCGARRLPRGCHWAPTCWRRLQLWRPPPCPSGDVQAGPRLGPPPCPSGNVQAGPRLGRGEQRVSGSEGTGGQEPGWGGREAARGSVSESPRGWEGGRCPAVPTWPGGSEQDRGSPQPQQRCGDGVLPSRGPAPVSQGERVPKAPLSRGPQARRRVMGSGAGLVRPSMGGGAGVTLAPH